MLKDIITIFILAFAACTAAWAINPMLDGDGRGEEKGPDGLEKDGD